MGFWGFRPFQNDYALDEYGGYRETKSLIGRFWQGIKRGAEYSVDVNEICGALLRSFDLYDGIMSKDTEIELITAIASSKFNEDTHDAMHESAIMMLCVATIDLDEREKMLSYAVNKFKAIIEANNFQPEFDKDELWIDINLDEENSEYQQIYNLARQTVNCDFENVETPMALTEENVKWLINERDRFENSRRISRFNMDFPNGIIITTMNFNSGIRKVAFNDVNKGFKILGGYHGDSIYGLDLKDIKTIDMDLGSLLNKYFPNGFIIYKSDHDHSGTAITSIDTDEVLKGSIDVNTTSYFRTDITSIKQIAKYVPVYKTKQQYEQSCNAKKHDDKLGIKVKCTNKFYNKNKIIAYELMDIQGKKIKVVPEALKDAIRKKQVNCLNLTLTSDNRLISK